MKKWLNCYSLGGAGPHRIEMKKLEYIPISSFPKIFFNLKIIFYADQFQSGDKDDEIIIVSGTGIPRL